MKIDARNLIPDPVQFNRSLINMNKNRQSIRLKNYDYSQSGLYYVTICTQNRKNLFGDVVGGKMILNECGNMIEKWWIKIPERFNTVRLGTFQIMPNHIHMIIHIVGADPCVRPTQHDPHVRPNMSINGSTRGSTPTVGTMIQWFKTMSTNEYIKNVHDEKWKPFDKRLWQRNYYEHVIRTENDLRKIREYIKTNPQIWYRDRNNI